MTLYDSNVTYDADIIYDSREANASAALPVVTCTPPGASATGAALCVSDFGTITSTPASAAATGSGAAAPSLPTVTLSAPTATASLGIHLPGIEPGERFGHARITTPDSGLTLTSSTRDLNTLRDY